MDLWGHLYWKKKIFPIALCCFTFGFSSLFLSFPPVILHFVKSLYFCAHAFRRRHTLQFSILLLKNHNLWTSHTHKTPDERYNFANISHQTRIFGHLQTHYNKKRIIAIIMPSLWTPNQYIHPVIPIAIIHIIIIT